MITWTTKPFSELTAVEIYEIIRARELVFVEEQNINYVDCDRKDFEALHVCGYLNQELVAYTRLFAPGVVYKEAAIGRVLTTQSGRGKGLGKRLMEESVAQVYKNFGKVPIKISAQLYLQKFYEEQGFEKISEPYMEEGIVHISMKINN